MNYHWIRDRKTRDKIKLYWEKGANNNEDYTTKHHPAKYHVYIRNTKNYVHDMASNEL